MEPQPHLHPSAEHRVAEHTAADRAADTEAVHREPEDKELPAGGDTDLEVREDTDLAEGDTDLEVVEDTDPAGTDIGPEAVQDIAPDSEERHFAVLLKNRGKPVNFAPAKEPWFHRIGGSGL